MSAYFDTPLLVKTYVWEEDSARAVELVESCGMPLAFSHLHEVEIPNAIRLKGFRGEISSAQAAAAVRAFRDDIEQGRFVRPDYNLTAIFPRAEKLSMHYSLTLGTRSLDLLHVAAALEMRCDAFASLDVRQRKCAKREGLRCLL